MKTNDKMHINHFAGCLAHSVGDQIWRRGSLQHDLLVLITLYQVSESILNSTIYVLHLTTLSLTPQMESSSTDATS